MLSPSAFAKFMIMIGNYYTQEGSHVNIDLNGESSGKFLENGIS